MTQVIVVCEGQTEEAFVSQVLAPCLVKESVFAEPRLISTSPHAKGGSLNRQRVLHYLRNTLRERSDTYVTTFFDLYGLPSKFFGVSGASRRSDPIERAKEIEAAFCNEVISRAECRRDRFLPHIQPHEFEALLFSDVSRFADVEPRWRALANELQSARESAKTPEHINDGAQTHPSARLQHLNPPYRKVLHGTIVSEKIGISRIRAECLHFDRWLKRLEALSPQQPT